MKQKILSLLLVLVALITLTGCGKSTKEKDAINIASLKGPTSIGLVKLYNNSDNDKSSNKYNYNIFGSADEISTKLVKGDLDIAAIPANLAAILYNKTEGKIQIAGINTLGVLYILAKGCDINSVAELKGKTIYTTGQGTTPEYTLRHILSEKGLNPDKDITIEFLSEASEVVAKCAEMDTAVMMLPEPYVEIALAKDSALKTVINTTEEWPDVTTGVVVIRKDFYEKNPDALKSFLSEYKASTVFASENVDECAELLEKFDIFKAAIAKKAIPKCNVTLISGNEMKEKLIKYYQVLFDENPASVGGKLPDDNAFLILN